MIDQSEVEDLARKSGMSAEEYCLQRIREWESMLGNFREDYRALPEQEFEDKLDDKTDSYSQYAPSFSRRALSLTSALTHSKSGHRHIFSTSGPLISSSVGLSIYVVTIHSVS